MLAGTQQWLAMVVCAIAISSAGCVLSVHPLSDAETSRIDKQLLGNWETGDNQTAKLKIEPHKKIKNAYLWTSTDAKDKEQEFLVYATRIKDQTYLSVLLRHPQKKQRKAFLFQQYTVKDDELQLFNADRDAWVAAIRAKRVPGVAGTGDEVNQALDKRLAELARQKGKPSDETKPEYRVNSNPNQIAAALVTPSTAELRKLVADPSLELFDDEKPTTYRRVK